MLINILDITPYELYRSPTGGIHSKQETDLYQVGEWDWDTRKAKKKMNEKKRMNGMAVLNQIEIRVS